VTTKLLTMFGGLSKFGNRRGTSCNACGTSRKMLVLLILSVVSAGLMLAVAHLHLGAPEFRAEARPVTLPGASKKVRGPVWLTHKGHDGLGHQLLGTFSCMVLAQIEPAKYRYGERHQWQQRVFGHGSKATWTEHNKNCSDLMHALHAGWPTIPDKSWPRPLRLDNCFSLIKAACGDESTVPNKACNDARRAVAAIWRRNFRQWHPSTAGPDVAMHIRMGDRASDTEIIIDDYVDLFSRDSLPIGQASNITVIAQRAGEVNEIVSKIPKANLAPSMHTVSPSIRTVHDFIQMVNAGIFVVHTSSYSLAAAIIRRGRTYTHGGRFSHGGRYDAHAFNCHLPNSSWWYEDSYANTTCDPARRV
jgi:hypothetical protein